MKRIITTAELHLVYARDFLLFSSSISAVTYYVWTQVGLDALTAIIWLKLLTIGLGLYYHQKRKSPQIFFYMNTGIGLRMLLVSAVIMDLTFWLIGFVILINTNL